MSAPRLSRLLLVACTSAIAACSSGDDSANAVQRPVSDEASGIATLPNGTKTCRTGAKDDGTAAALGITVDGLDCWYRDYPSDWAAAVKECEGSGGYRLPTKAEALAIQADRATCRNGATRLPTRWYTWSGTCADAGFAWFVYANGEVGKAEISTRGTIGALCVR